MNDDTALIVATAHDYFEGWFDGDVSRIQRALHRDLVKRSSHRDQASTLSFVTADQMITWTGEGVHVAEPYYEYLHLVRSPEGWQIANALWCTP